MIWMASGFVLRFITGILKADLQPASGEGPGWIRVDQKPTRVNDEGYWL